MTDRVVWIVGDPTVPEFQAALQQVELKNRVRYVDARGPASVAIPDPKDEHPHFVLFLSPRPESFSRSWIDQWQQRYPLARFVVLLGSWCEGEVRSGRPWPGVTRVYWHQAARLEFADAAAGGFTNLWNLPRTATDAERLDAAVHGATAAPVSGESADSSWACRVGVRAARRTQTEDLADACRWSGFCPVDCFKSTGDLPRDIAALVWDWDRSFDLELATRQLAANFRREVPILALVNFPRWQDVLAARPLGITILAKPYRITDLRWQLEQMLELNDGR